MVSRQKILMQKHRPGDFQRQSEVEEEDLWLDKEKLCRDHVQEVLSKWRQIDDEIWAKIVVFERNRRVAKAYARAPVLTVNGSEAEFDGFRIGLNGFDSPNKDRKTEECKRHVGHGIKVKMDEAGNILIKRVAKSNVYVKSINPQDENSISNEILKLQNGALPADKPMKLFDMAKFQANLKREFKQAYPDRRRLERQCLSAVSFVRNESGILDCPIWVLIVNIVAIEMLKSKIPPVDHKDRPRIPIPEDEDPYSLPGRSNEAAKYVKQEKPPKLPPREAPDYPKDKSKSPKDKKQYEDPYYHGLKARVSNLVAKTKSKLRKPPPPKHEAPSPFPTQSYGPQQRVLHVRQHPMWYTRSYESGLDSDFSESPYSKIYGKIPIPRGYIPRHPAVHLGEWESRN